MDNVIAEKDSEGNKAARFQATEAWKVPESIENLCSAFNEAIRDDHNKYDNAEKWRVLIEKTICELKYNNVTYINGLDLLGDISLISADETHPNVYVINQITSRLEDLLKCEGK